MIKVAIVVIFPPRFISPDSLISMYISNNWSGKNAHNCGSVIILLKNGKAHNTINGIIIAVVVECVIADTSIPHHYPYVFKLHVSFIMYFSNQIVFHYINFSCTFNKEGNPVCLLFCKYDNRHNLLAIINKYFCAESIQNHTKL